MDREIDLEDISLRIDDMDINYDVMKEFVVNKLKEFDERLKKIESESVTDVSMQDVSSARHYYDRMSSQLPGLSPIVKKPVSSSPSMAGSSNRKKIPFDIEEICNEELREEMRKLLPAILDVKEKLNKVQMSFFLYWVTTNDVKGRKDEAKQLVRSGEKARVWYPGYLPEGVKDFTEYLYEKLRGHVRKMKRSSKRQEMDVAYDLANQVVSVE